MDNQPAYIGPYSADTYDEMYGKNVLFTPAVEMPYTSTKADVFYPEKNIIIGASILAISILAYFLIKKYK